MMAFDNLPRAIATFLHEAGKRDIPAVFAMFAPDAVLVDKGAEFRGDAIREWNERFFLKEERTAHPINVERRGSKTVLTVMIRGNHGQIGASSRQQNWEFAVSDGKISRLTIDPVKSPELPAPVAAYVLAVNTFDLEALLDTFAEDALVNDQLREYWGSAAVRAWAAREMIGERVTMYVVKAVAHHGNAVVTANVDGDFDKRGLPNPLVVSFYFSIHREKIVQLIVLRNEPDV
jgi:ketosteroid isomerase-like protein